MGKRAEAWGQDTKNTPQADTLEQRWVNIWTILSTSAAKILDMEGHVSRRRITQKAIRIHQVRPELNMDTGLDIPVVIPELVSHDPEGSCDTNGH